MRKIIVLVLMILGVKIWGVEISPNQSNPTYNNLTVQTLITGLNATLTGNVSISSMVVTGTVGNTLTNMGQLWSAKDIRTPSTGKFGFVQVTSGTITQNLEIGGLVNSNGETRLVEKYRLSGQEYYQAANTSNDGIGLIMYINRTGNRQMGIADTALLGLTSWYGMVRVKPVSFANDIPSNYSVIDALSLNGGTQLPIGFGTVGANTYVAGTNVVVKNTEVIRSTWSVIGNFDNAGYIAPGTKTSTELKTYTPIRVGEIWGISDVSGSIVISTGIVVNGFKQIIGITPTY